MSLFELNGISPSLGKGVYVSESADVIGRVSVGDDASIWFNCVLRGDINDISIGSRTNIQDGSILHVVEKHALVIGNEVTIGHKVTLHACTVEDNCLIGMDAVVLDGVTIGANSLVAAGSVCPPGKKYPPGVLIMGSPAVVVRELTAEEKEQYGNHFKSYILAKNSFLKSCKKIDS